MAMYRARREFKLEHNGEGTLIDDFEIMSILGKGNFGAVYLAKHKPSGTMVALKKMVMPDQETVEDVQREVQMMEEIHNPYVVTYYGSFETVDPKSGEDILWIVMEYCEGGSVADGLQACNEPMTEEQIACLCESVLKGLTYLHKSGMAHRDIKPDNVLITGVGEAKLADFGVSGQRGRGEAFKTLVGTPFFLAPEMISAESSHSGYGVNVDVWALGISTLEMAELSVPYADQNPMRAVFQILENEAPRLDNSKGIWSKKFCDFVARCLTKDPEKRPSAHALLKHPFIDSSKDPFALINLVGKWNAAREARGKKKSKSGEFERIRVASPAPPSKSDFPISIPMPEFEDDPAPVQGAGSDLALGIDPVAPIPAASTQSSSSTSPNDSVRSKKEKVGKRSSRTDKSERSERRSKRMSSTEEKSDRSSKRASSNSGEHSRRVKPSSSRDGDVDSERRSSKEKRTKKSKSEL